MDAVLQGIDETIPSQFGEQDCDVDQVVLHMNVGEFH
jgi:hypothetical protein